MPHGRSARPGKWEPNYSEEYVNRINREHETELEKLKNCKCPYTNGEACFHPEIVSGRKLWDQCNPDWCPITSQPSGHKKPSRWVGIRCCR